MKQILPTETREQIFDMLNQTSNNSRRITELLIKLEEAPKDDRLLIDAIADIAFYAGSIKYYSGDSRADIYHFINLAEEFAKLHHKTDWEEIEYIDTIDAYMDDKFAEYKEIVDAAIAEGESLVKEDYICIWGKGCDFPQIDRKSIEFFQAKKGYDALQHYNIISQLEVGQHAEISDDGDHFVFYLPSEPLKYSPNKSFLVYDSNLDNLQKCNFQELAERVGFNSDELWKIHGLAVGEWYDSSDGNHQFYIIRSK